MTASLLERTLKSALLAGAGFAVLASAALAQEPAPAPATTDTAATTSGEEEVTVTGSRIRNRNVTSNSPIATVSEEFIKNTGKSNIEEIVNILPQFTPDIGATTNNGGGGAAYINLRGLGAERTLVLVNGRRFIPAGIGGLVDVNVIPAAAIERIEVVSGGASAVYGADAVAGVVNFILKDDFEGVEVSGQFGTTEPGDANTVSGSALMGVSLDEGKGHMTLFSSYYNQDALFRDRRDISNPDLASATTAWGRIDSLGVIPADAAAVNAALNARFAGYGAPAGNRPTVDNQIGFNNDGTLWVVASGSGAAARVNYNRKDAVAAQTGCENGSSLCSQNIANENYLIVPTTRYSLGATGSYEIAPNVNAFAELTFVNWQNANALAATPVTGIMVPVGALGVTGSGLEPILAARSNATDAFQFRRRFAELGPRTEFRDNFAYGITLGLDGSFGDSWTWETFYSWQKAATYANQTGLVNIERLANALGSPKIGSVTYNGGGTVGVAPCTNGGAACVPIDILGAGTISQAAADYISTFATYNTSLIQQQVGASVTGDVFNPISESPIGLAFGVEFRSSELAQNPDVNLVPQDPTDPSSCLTPALNCIQKLSAYQDVYEAFMEARIPLLEGISGVKYLGLELGARVSDYDTIGTTNTYKAGAEWAVDDQWRFRGMYQRAVRAPTVFDSSGPSAQDFPQVADDGSDDFCSQNASPTAAIRAYCGSTGVVNPLTFQSTQEQVQAFNLSNPNIQPEEADTYTLGVVFTGGDVVPGLTGSLDYYDIGIAGAIVTPSPAAVFAACRAAIVAGTAATNQYCNAITRSGTGEVESMQLLIANLGKVGTSGLDLTANYGIDLEDLGAGADSGHLSFDLYVNYLLSFKVTEFNGVTPERDLLGTTGRPELSTNTANTYPEWRVNLRTTYSIGDFDFQVAYRYLSSVTDVTDADTGAGNPVAAYHYFDLRTQYAVTENLSVYLGINNVFDKQPPFLESAFNANTDGSTYDVLGRAYYVGFTGRF